MIILSADDDRAAVGGESALPHAARERSAARRGEEIKKLVPVRASGPPYPTEASSALQPPILVYRLRRVPLGIRYHGGLGRGGYRDVWGA
jgi:hypothetical protein